ncbi:hypothetical protein [Bradyrhizobium sp. Arg816]|uniref:hypothetical protein n=1 Tax=Bradyrhizobium sp. Arg816 TaxID=2998491 RepID=UPI00249DD614|nr:hypothetical protein [Bradyrhizobium sp. Arg816]MDI3564204.1 hypothetical protein [Bradyrhizobium sp. Arg816]
MKFCPPGAEPFRTLHRIDGWFGSPEEVPDSVVRLIVGKMPTAAPRSVAEATRARMMVRQLKYELSQKVVLARRNRFGLETR